MPDVHTAVLLPAHNAEKTLRRAVDSILTGTLPCRIFVVDDGSRVPVDEVLPPHEAIEIIRLAPNRGVAAALNAGLARILAGSFRYVARMDADDVAYPDRLERQVAWLDRHPSVAVVGAWTRHVAEDTATPLKIARQPCDPADVRKAMFFNNALSHPTAVLRADVLRREGVYSTRFPAAEDYELFRRIGRTHLLAAVPEVLLDYQVSAAGVSVARRRQQLRDRLRVQLKYFEPLEWRAWAGIVRTVMTQLLPGMVATRLKYPASAGEL